MYGDDYRGSSRLLTLELLGTTCLIIGTISDHEDDIAEVVSNVLDSKDIPSAHDLEYNLDMLNYEE